MVFNRFEFLLMPLPLCVRWVNKIKQNVNLFVRARFHSFISFRWQSDNIWLTLTLKCDCWSILFNVEKRKWKGRTKMYGTRKGWERERDCATQRRWLECKPSLCYLKLWFHLSKIICCKWRMNESGGGGTLFEAAECWMAVKWKKLNTLIQAAVSCCAVCMRTSVVPLIVLCSVYA